MAERRSAKYWLLAGLVIVASGCAHVDVAQPGGRVVVITGASSGFGHGVALELAARGDHVVLAARRAELLAEVARACEARGGRALVVPTDVAVADDVAQLAAAAVREFGRIDVWINNAGVGAIGRFDEVPVEDHARVIDVNLKGVIHGSHEALRQFRRQGGRGVLINVSSVAGKIGYAYMSSYAASKHGVRGLTASLHEELRVNGEHGIRVCAILPYAADTPWWPNAANYTGHSPRMLWIDPPQKVIDAIVTATARPRKEISVGWKAKLFLATQRITPGLTERVAGNIAHRQFIEIPPPAPIGSGNLHEPGRAAGIEGGVRAKIRAEDAARERAAAPRN